VVEPSYFDELERCCNSDPGRFLQYKSLHSSNKIFKIILEGMPISTCHNIISKMHPQLSSKSQIYLKVKRFRKNWNIFTKFRVQFTGDSGSKMILVQSCRKWWGAPGSEFWYLWNGFQINSNRQNHGWKLQIPT